MRFPRSESPFPGANFQVNHVKLQGGMSKLGVCFVPGIFWKFLGRLLMDQEIRHSKAPDKVGIVNLPKHFRRLFIHPRWL